MFPLIASLVGGAVSSGPVPQGFQPPPPPNNAMTAMVAISAVALIGGLLYFTLRGR